MTQVDAPAARRAVHPAGPKRQAVGRGGTLALSPPLSERRREANRGHSGSDTDLLCECGNPVCRATLPPGADLHRVTADCYIVVPNHLNGGTPVRLADEFFVIRAKSRPASNDDLTS